MRRLFGGLLVITALLTALSLVYMDSAATDCSAVVRGAPGDGTSGSVWMNWLWEKEGGSPLASEQAMTGAARGDALWRPVNIVNSGWSLPMWAASQVVGPVCGYNAVIIGAQVASGVSMWLLAYFITRSRLASTVGSLGFAFSSFVQMKSEGHVSGVAIYGFPLLVMSLLWLWARPSWRRAVATAVPWAALAYTDGYYLPFSLVVVGAFSLGVSVVELRVHHIGIRPLFRRLRWIVAAGAIALALMMPFAVITLSNRGTINTERTRDLAQLERFSARPAEYFVPPYSHPVFGDLVGDFRLDNIHQSNTTETALYLGTVLLLLAVVGLAISARASGADASSTVVQRWDAPPLATTVGALVAVGAAAFLTSLQPNPEVFGIRLVMPSRIVHAVFPQVRSISRLFIVVSCVTALFAAIGMRALLSRQRSNATRLAFTAVVSATVLFDSLTYEPLRAPVWSFDQSPVAYALASDDPSVTMVARYPLSTVQDDPNNFFLTFQPALDKPIVNAVADTAQANDPTDIARGLAGLEDPYTVAGLRALQTSTVFVERQVMGEMDPQRIERLGLELVRAFHYAIDDGPRQGNGGADRWSYLSPYYDLDQYRILPGPTAPALLALGAGWSGFERDGWSGGRWMTGEGELTAVGVDDGPAAVTIAFFAIPFAEERTVEVLDGSLSVARFVVPEGGGTVSFRAPVDTKLTLRSSPEPTLVTEVDPASPDTRELAIRISAIDVRR